jgi:hypothetical protein
LRGDVLDPRVILARRVPEPLELLLPAAPRDPLHERPEPLVPPHLGLELPAHEQDVHGPGPRRLGGAHRQPRAAPRRVVAEVDVHRPHPTRPTPLRQHRKNARPEQQPLRLHVRPAHDVDRHLPVPVVARLAPRLEVHRVRREVLGHRVRRVHVRVVRQEQPRVVVVHHQDAAPPNVPVRAPQRRVHRVEAVDDDAARLGRDEGGEAGGEGERRGRVLYRAGRSRDARGRSRDGFGLGL